MISSEFERICAKNIWKNPVNQKQKKTDGKEMEENIIRIQEFRIDYFWRSLSLKRIIFVKGWRYRLRVRIRYYVLSWLRVMMARGPFALVSSDWSSSKIKGLLTLVVLSTYFLLRPISLCLMDSIPSLAWSYELEVIYGALNMILKAWYWTPWRSLMLAFERRVSGAA